MPVAAGFNFDFMARFGSHYGAQGGGNWVLADRRAVEQEPHLTQCPNYLMNGLTEDEQEKEEE
jgi:hypothetical protein